MSVRIKHKNLLNLEWKEQTKQQVPYKTKTCKLTYILFKLKSVLHRKHRRRQVTQLSTLVAESTLYRFVSKRVKIRISVSFRKL